MVIAVSFARIHWQNLINFGILTVTFLNADDKDKIEQGDILAVGNLINSLKEGNKIMVTNKTKKAEIETVHTMSKRQVDMILEGSLIELVKNKFKNQVGN